jgi:hypothetical protein
MVTQPHVGLFSTATAKGTINVSKIKSGGGLTSNKLVTPSVRTGAPNRDVNPAYAAQLGRSLDPKVIARTPENTKAMPAPRYGNAVALNSKSAPGQGRTIMRSGSQSQHGEVAGSPRPQGRDILSEFGPERGRR